MIPSWLKPNKVGIALFIVFSPFILLFFILSSLVVLPTYWLWKLGNICLVISLPVAYPIFMSLGRRIKRKNMKIRYILLLTVAGLVLCFCVLSTIYIAFSRNIGLPFGYYGEFNRVKWRLQDIGSIKILDHFQHRDLRLEDFGFTLQTNGGMKFHIEFYDGNKTYELFDEAAGLAVKMLGSQSWTLYSFRPGEHLESATGKEIRNAVDVLENFDKIAEVVENDQQKGISEVGWEGVSQSYIRIIIPSFSPQPVE